MERSELLTSPEYWTTKAQFELYACAEDYMRSHNMNRTKLAEHLGVSKGYVSQLLNGDYDHKLSKLVELALSFGVVPKIVFQPIEEALAEDNIQYIISQYKSAEFNVEHSTEKLHVQTDDLYQLETDNPNNIAA